MNAKIFKHPEFEAIAKYSHFQGWTSKFEVEYEKGTNNQDWQVVTIGDPDSSSIRMDFTRWHFLRMGEALARSDLLCSIDLSNCKISKDSLTVLFGRNYNQAWPQLEYLNLSGNRLGRIGMEILEPFLKSRSSLATLNLDNNNVGVNGVKCLSRALNYVHVDDLYLDGNNIGDEGVEWLLFSRNAAYLSQLWLNCNGIKRSGYSAIAQFLQNRETKIKTLYFADNSIDMDGEVAKSLASSLANSNTIEYINIGSRHVFTGSYAIANFIQHFERTSCNLENFKSLCESNHVLRSFGDDIDGYIANRNDTLRVVLDINARDAPVGTKIRSKFRQFYFVGEFNMDPFIDLDAKLMPSALELVTMSEENCSQNEDRLEEDTPVLARNGSFKAIYRLLRNYWNLQDLFSYTSPESRIKQLEAENKKLRDEITQLKMANGKSVGENGVSKDGCNICL